MKLATPSKKAVLIGLSGVLLLVLAGLLVFYGLSIWPKRETQLGKKNETDTSKVKTEVVTPAKLEP